MQLGPYSALLCVGAQNMARDVREYGLTESDRKWVIRKKFGLFSAGQINQILNKVENPSEKVLGAILFLARPGSVEDVESSVFLANTNESNLLNAAQVKNDRT